MITGIYCGDYEKAHFQGCSVVSEKSRLILNKQFPVVITSNGGYPLDQNLYQTVKGISAAARIVEPGGTIFVISECRDGIPSHGSFAYLMSQRPTPDGILDYIRNLNQPTVDQWQAQILAMILQKVKVGLYSSLMPADVRGCMLQPVADLQSEIDKRIRSSDRKISVAVLPDGPLIIPTVAGV
jgi:nickel-dependent lactate racemase